jgi:alcohol dehydrogenase class IV
MYSALHGVVCARLLPNVIELNVRALQSRAPESPALKRYDKVAQILTGKPFTRAGDGIAWIQELCAVLKVAPLAVFGLQESDFPVVTAKAKNASSMKGNPITLTDAELTEILSKSL